MEALPELHATLNMAQGGMQCLALIEKDNRPWSCHLKERLENGIGPVDLHKDDLVKRLRGCDTLKLRVERLARVAVLREKAGDDEDGWRRLIEQR